MIKQNPSQSFKHFFCEIILNKFENGNFSKTIEKERIPFWRNYKVLMVDKTWSTIPLKNSHLFKIVKSEIFFKNIN